MLRTLILGLASCAAGASAPDFPARLARQGLRYEGARDYGSVDDRAWDETGSRRLSAAAGATLLKISSEADAGEDAARRRLGEWRARFLGLFDGDAAYPGMVTHSLRTPEALRPRELPALSGGRKVWLAPATDRLTIGAGADDLVRYWAVVSFRWCPAARRSVELELFFPKESFQRKAALAEEAAFSCAAPAR